MQVIKAEVECDFDASFLSFSPVHFTLFLVNNGGYLEQEFVMVGGSGNCLAKHVFANARVKSSGQKKTGLAHLAGTGCQSSCTSCQGIQHSFVGSRGWQSVWRGGDTQWH